MIVIIPVLGLFQHQAIQEFPSEQFYENKLETQLSFQREPSDLQVWPGGVSCPIAFCHIEGKEVTLPVTTAEGSEQSKSNMEEVQVIVSSERVTLKNRYSIHPS